MNFFKFVVLLLITFTFNIYSQITVILPDTIAIPGQMKIPVRVLGLNSSHNVISFQFKVTFDNTILTATGIETTNTIIPSSGWTVLPQTNTPGEIQVAGFGATAIQSSGNLVWLVFNVSNVNYSVLHWDNFTFNNGTPAVTLVDGSVPVELISFSALQTDNAVLLNWSTATETNNKGFDVERQSPADAAWEKIGHVFGFGTTTELKNYTFTDDQLTTSGEYSYRLKQIDYNGTFEYSNVISVNIDLTPENYTLYQNYPNPFNPSTSICYDLPENGFVTLKIYDLIGNEVATLVNENKAAGKYKIEFNALNLSNGVYFYELRAGNFKDVKKLVLLK